jgi:hypothetical protein
MSSTLQKRKRRQVRYQQKKMLTLAGRINSRTLSGSTPTAGGVSTRSEAKWPASRRASLPKQAQHEQFRRVETFSTMRQ